MDTLQRRTASATETELAERRATYYTGLLWHVGAFLIVNGFFWALDLATGADGIQWAYWITAVWAFALAFHVLAYLIDGRQLRERKTQQYLDDRT